MAFGSLFSKREAASASAEAPASSHSSKPSVSASSGAKATKAASATAAANEAKTKATKQLNVKMDQIKVIITGDKSSVSTGTAGLESVTSTCPSLSRKQRLAGFACCFVIGYVISFGSTFALIAGDDNGAKFGITYTLGNIIALCASGFLVGPCQQVKLMMKPVRRVAALIYLVMIAVVFAVALAAPHLGGLVLFLVFIQFLAAIWYSASYVPFGRKIIASIGTKICGGVAGS